MPNVIFKYGDLGCLLFWIGNTKKNKNTVPNPGYFLKYWHQLRLLELRNIYLMKMQKLLKWQITPTPQNRLASFSLLFFFLFFFLFLSGITPGNMQWNNIPHTLTRGKDTCISKDASMQCYLGTLKWNIQLVLHLSAARQQQVTRGNILLLLLSSFH